MRYQADSPLALAPVEEPAECLPDVSNGKLLRCSLCFDVKDSMHPAFTVLLCASVGNKLLGLTRSSLMLRPSCASAMCILRFVAKTSSCSGCLCEYHQRLLQKVPTGSIHSLPFQPVFCLPVCLLLQQPKLTICMQSWMWKYTATSFQ